MTTRPHINAERPLHGLDPMRNTAVERHHHLWPKLYLLRRLRYDEVNVATDDLERDGRKRIVIMQLTAGVHRHQDHAEVRGFAQSNRIVSHCSGRLRPGSCGDVVEIEHL